MAQDRLSGALAGVDLAEQAEGAESDQAAPVTIVRPGEGSIHSTIQYQSEQSIVNGGQEKKKDATGDADGQGGPTSVKLVPVSMPAMSGANLVSFPSSAGDIPGITMVAFPHGAGMAGAQMQLPSIIPQQQSIFQPQAHSQSVLPSSLSGEVGSEDAGRKREMRLLKNREAAKECRRKKKEYVRCLENRVAVLEAQNKTLIEELKQLKDLYCNKAE